MFYNIQFIRFSLILIKLKLPKNVIPKFINDLAYERFQQATEKIDSIKKGIHENRIGEATTDIQTDSDKLSKRIARENMPISAALERINGVPNFQDINILYKILKISESVGRITIKTRYGNSGYGTGFLVAPGILITNNHVFPDAENSQTHGGSVLLRTRRKQ